MQSCIYLIILLDLHLMVSCNRNLIFKRAKIGYNCAIIMLHNPTQNHNRNKGKNTNGITTPHFHETVVWWMLCPAPLRLVHSRLPSSLSHRLWLRSLASEADQSASGLTCMYAIHHGCFWGICDGLFSAVCPYSNSGRQGWILGIHFIWMGTVRIMMINTTNPHVCIVLGIRIAELIHWSFHGGFGESVQQNTEFIWDPQGIIYKLSVV